MVEPNSFGSPGSLISTMIQTLSNFFDLVPNSEVDIITGN